ncbi:hypothetical protein Egran_05401 [Elaphomyces granulatus]|uniref:Uncharacterized protein n=1 Tax=Elaphomyces granulatus TaxID=519963 RepID=A0A232LRT0_9EURO|nr:hypothetical protein Egran_05401 [Elaphomyces granulatus]
MQSLASVLSKLPGNQRAAHPKNEAEMEEHAMWVLRWLAVEGNSNWLLIFDNVDQYSSTPTESGDGYDVSEFFPVADHGSIIITTRLARLKELGEFHPVRRLASEEAVRLLFKSSGHKMRGNERGVATDADSINLADRLDGLPLAIVIAGSFISNTGVSFARYLQIYEESWRDLQSITEPHRHYSNGNILTTWMITYSEIQKVDPFAVKLLFLLSYFHNRDIWVGLIRCGLKSSNTPDWFRTVASNEIRFLTTVRTLVNFSLIETKEANGYYMHPVVQDWCRHGFSEIDEGDKDKLKTIALASVGHAVSLDSEIEYWVLQRRLLPHATQMLAVLESGWPIPQDPSVLQAVYQLGHLYSNQGKLKEAELMYQWALMGQEKTLDLDHPSTLLTVHSLGNVYSDQGRLEKAELMYQQALAGYAKILTTYEKTLGPDHMETVRIVHDLGDLYQDQGKLEEAETMYRRALTKYSELLGPDHPHALTTVNWLGNLYSDQDRLKEAGTMYQQALTGYTKTMGPDHTFTLGAVLCLGNLYQDQGKLNEAEIMYQKALLGYEKALGPDHTSTLATIHCLGNLFKDQDKWREAEIMYQRALTGREKVLGPDHKSTLTTASRLGTLYTDQQKLKEAEAMYRRALSGFEMALGRDHTFTLAVIGYLGNVYRGQCKLEEAEEMYNQALAGYEKALGPDHTSTLTAVDCLGNLYRDQGKLKDAELMYRRALAGREKALGLDHLSTLATVNNLGNIYSDQGKLKDAERMYQRALAGREKELGPDHRDTLLVADTLYSLATKSVVKTHRKHSPQRIINRLGYSTNMLLTPHPLVLATRRSDQPPKQEEEHEVD